MGQPAVAAVADTWAQLCGHRSNILQPEMRQMGLGLTRDAAARRIGCWCARQPAVSSQIVTGPSFSRLTAMSAPKMPLATVIPWAASWAEKCS